jgi:hypothetical protein
MQLVGSLSLETRLVRCCARLREAVLRGCDDDHLTYLARRVARLERAREEEEAA